MTTPDPLSWLGPTRWDAGVRQNRAHYVAASDMVNEMANTRDPEQRREQQVEILAKLNQDVAHGIIMWFPRTWARRNHVNNVRVTPYQNYWFTETWVDE